MATDQSAKKPASVARKQPAGKRRRSKVCRNLKLEGIVSKWLSEPYISGCSGLWTKAKCGATRHAIVLRLKQLEIDVSPFSAPMPHKSGRAIQLAKPDLVARIEMTTWTK